MRDAKSKGHTRSISRLVTTTLVNECEFLGILFEPLFDVRDHFVVLC